VHSDYGEDASTVLPASSLYHSLVHGFMCNYCMQLFRIWAGLLLSISGCDVTSKMSADEKLLLLSAAVSAATISLVAFSCKRKRKRAK